MHGAAFKKRFLRGKKAQPIWQKLLSPSWWIARRRLTTTTSAAATVANRMTISTLNPKSQGGSCRSFLAGTPDALLHRLVIHSYSDVTRFQSYTHRVGNTLFALQSPSLSTNFSALMPVQANPTTRRPL
jgi:hypothetical protein